MTTQNTINKENEATKIINQINQITKHNWIIQKIKNITFILLEIFCYILLLFSLFSMLSIHDNEVINFFLLLTEVIDKDLHINIKELTEVYFFIKKVIIFFLLVIFLIPALLFRKLRKKNNLIEKINVLTEKYIKEFSTKK